MMKEFQQKWFQFHNGSIKSPSFAAFKQAKKSFNSTMVRLKDALEASLKESQDGFNSTMVRLKVSLRKGDRQ